MSRTASTPRRRLDCGEGLREGEDGGRYRSHVRVQGGYVCDQLPCPGGGLLRERWGAAPRWLEESRNHCLWP